MTAPAVRRDGTVLADAWLPDLVRLGELEAHLGDGVIEEMVSAELAAGRLPRRPRRPIMSCPLVIRLMIAMTLMPAASYCEALPALAGLLAGVPLARGWHVPAEKAVTDWRLPVPPPVMEALFWQAAGPLTGDSGALRCVYRYTVADGILAEDENPAARVPKPPRVRSTRRALPDQRLEELAQVAASTGNDPALDALLLRVHTEPACRRGGMADHPLNANTLSNPEEVHRSPIIFADGLPSGMVETRADCPFGTEISAGGMPCAQGLLSVRPPTTGSTAPLSGHDGTTATMK